MKKLTFRDIFFKGAVQYNPVLIQCVALCPVIMATATLKNAVFAAIILSLELLITCAIASLLLKKLPRFIRVAVYLIIGLLIVCPALWYLETSPLYELDTGMKIYISLIAINSITAVRCETFSVKNSVNVAIYDAFASAVGTSGVLLIVGIIREIIGKGTIAGTAINIPVTLSGISLPFGCLIILGFLAAVLKAINGKITAMSEDDDSDETDEENFDEPETNSEDETPQQEEQAEAQDENDAETEAVYEIPTETDLDLADSEDDEYLDLLSSVNELIEKFSSNNGGEDQ